MHGVAADRREMVKYRRSLFQIAWHIILKTILVVSVKLTCIHSFTRAQTDPV